MDAHVNIAATGRAGTTASVDGGEAFEVVGGALASGCLILADHASNHIPPEFSSLGLPEAQLERHIAYDIGIAWMTRRLAVRLNAPAVMSRFSRLLIDPNRGDDDPTLVMQVSDGAIVPGNKGIAAAGVAERMRRFSLPYHAAVSEALAAFHAAGVVPAVVSLHSFTPEMKGRKRPWHVGILWDSDPRLPVPVLEAFHRQPDMIVGDNEPYDGALAGDTMARHCISAGLAHILIEIRQDLIATETDAHAWADRLAAILAPALTLPEVHRIKLFGTRAR
jgi:predicted N-formylglutamate amidohydrolase